MVVTSYSSGRQFPDAVCVGGWLYVSGQVATDEDNRLIGEGDIATQTRAAFTNLRSVLAGAGCSMVDVIKLNTYFVYLGPESELSNYWGLIDTTRRQFLIGASPAATAVRVAGFSRPGLLIEVDAVAHVPPSSSPEQAHVG